MAAVAAKFRVELEKLRDTAAKLQTEVDELQGSADDMAGNPHFGHANVVGVGRLSARHHKVVAPTQKLISDIRGGIAAGEEALRIVASRYEAADSSGSEKMQRAAEQALDDEGFAKDPEHSGGHPIP